MTLEDILRSENVIGNINNYAEYIFELIPELKPMVGFPHNHPHHFLDVWEHTLLAVGLAPEDLEIRLVLLLHDIGKPHTYQDVDGVRHFWGHAETSSIMAKSILERLYYNEDFIDEVCYLIKMHDTPIEVEDIKENYSLAIKRYIVQQADAYAHKPSKLEKRCQYLTRTKNLFDKYAN